MTSGLGAFGESWAAGYLTRLGYRIVERNVRYRRGEIDIVAWDGPDLVFVEVKCRRSSLYGSPADSITPMRFRHLATAIDHYLHDRNLEPDSYRIDVVAMVVGRDGRVESHELLRGVEAPTG
jgi:putative endonuclease